MQHKLPTLRTTTFFFITLSSLVYSCSNPSSKQETANAKSKTFIKTDHLDLNQVTKQIHQNLDSSIHASLIIEGDTIANSIDFRNAYSANAYNPFWMNENGITQNVSDFLEVLASIKSDGLEENNYSQKKIIESIEQFKSNKIDAQTAYNFEVLMSKSFFQLSHDFLVGRIYENSFTKDWKNKNDSLLNFAAILKTSIESNDMKKVFEEMRPHHNYYVAFRNEYKRLDSIKEMGGFAHFNGLNDSIAIGTSSAAIPQLRKRLHSEIGMPVDTSSLVWSTDLLEGVKKFQYLNNIKPTGSLDTATLSKLNKNIDVKLNQLALNMERMRWMKHEFPQPYIWVDVPKMELNYVEHDSVQFNMRVVVGRPGRATTMLDAKLENIVFSPPWTVPPTIMKEEVVPGIARRGGSYLSRRGLKAYDRHGRVVNASAINSRNFRNYSIGQAPGYRSSLGEVKFNLPNPWSIYLHDTPHREDFVKSYRAFSSGCIRVHHPKEFAAFLLRDTSLYSFAKIDSICKKRKTQFVPITRNIMVHIVYLTNALDSVGNVMYLRDIYGWDPKVVLN